MITEYLDMKNNIGEVRRNVRVTLSGEDDAFVKWLAKRDRVSYQEELQMLFYTELREMQDFCREEYEGESK